MRKTAVGCVSPSWGVPKFSSKLISQWKMSGRALPVRWRSGRSLWTDSEWEFIPSRCHQWGLLLVSEKECQTRAGRLFQIRLRSETGAPGQVPSSTDECRKVSLGDSIKSRTDKRSWLRLGLVLGVQVRALASRNRSQTSVSWIYCWGQKARQKGYA